MRDSTFRTPAAARPRFGAGAFRGTVEPNSIGVLHPASVTDPATKLSPTAGIRPVDVTSFSAPNQLRLGVLRIIEEWWRWRTPFSGDYFVGPSVTRAVVARGMRPQGRFSKLVPSKPNLYEPAMYGAGTEGRTGFADRTRIRR